MAQAHHHIFKRLYENPLSKEEFFGFLETLKNTESQESPQTQIELLKAKGFPLYEDNDCFGLQTKNTSLHKQKFCFVDIETTGARPKEAQIIEIGAILYQDGKILDRFDELIFAPFVPEIITQITQITTDMLTNARQAHQVLREFKEFLGDSVFVAHNVGFDYSFVSYAMESEHLGELLNPKLCTIDLARRTILSKRYSLQYLNEFLGINTSIAHRAYADALTALEIFKISTLCLPHYITTTQDLIDFSKHSESKIKLR